MRPGGESAKEEMQVVEHLSNDAEKLGRLVGRDEREKYYQCNFLEEGIEWCNQRGLWIKIAWKTRTCMRRFSRKLWLKQRESVDH